MARTNFDIWQMTHINLTAIEEGFNVMQYFWDETDEWVGTYTRSK